MEKKLLECRKKKTLLSFEDQKKAPMIGGGRLNLKRYA